MPILHRRSLLAATLASTVAASAAPWFLRHARAADTQRFALGVASGQPTASGMVLWTMLTGAELPASAEVRWELAEDEAFTRIAARGSETAREQDQHSVHAEPAGLQPARWYWYRFTALGQASAVGRTRTAPAPDAKVDRLEFAIASCQRWDTGHYAAWRHAAAEPLDLVLFLGDYIYEYASSRQSLRTTQGGKVRTLADYRQRYAQYKSDPALQAAHAACPWLLVWDDHEVDNDYASLQGQDLQPDFAAQRAAAYRAYWEFMPFPKASRPADSDGSMRIVGRLDWGRLARIHLLDDRQYRDAQVCPRPGRGGSATVRLRDCPAFLDPARTLLGAEQERWLAESWSLERPWNLLAQQTLMARHSWEDPQGSSKDDPRGMYWTDGWDGYAPARNRLLGTVAQRKVPGVVVLGGDVHANYAADLKPDYDDPASPVVASEFCGTSISSLGLDQSRLETARPFNPHVKYSRADQRGYVRLSVTPEQTQASLRVLDDGRDPASKIATTARFSVAAGKPGIQAA
jgi:alkaline phosphatase D